MKRHYYISDDLDDLEIVERDLESAGVTTPQIHVLSEDDSGVESHHLHNVEAVLKKDVVHGTELGAVVGAIARCRNFTPAAWLSGLTETYTWVPAIFSPSSYSAFAPGKAASSAYRNPHSTFAASRSDLEQGKHILFVDVDPEQESILRQVVARHPKLVGAGEGDSTPRWVVGAQKKWTRFMQVAP